MSTRICLRVSIPLIAVLSATVASANQGVAVQNSGQTIILWADPDGTVHGANAAAGQGVGTFSPWEPIAGVDLDTTSNGAVSPPAIIALHDPPNGSNAGDNWYGMWQGPGNTLFTVTGNQGNPGLKGRSALGRRNARHLRVLCADPGVRTVRDDLRRSRRVQRLLGRHRTLQDLDSRIPSRGLRAVPQRELVHRRRAGGAARGRHRALDLRANARWDRGRDRHRLPGERRIARVRLLSGGSGPDRVVVVVGAIPDRSDHHVAAVAVREPAGGSRRRRAAAEQRPTTGGTYALGILGKCVDLPNGNTANGTPVNIWDCNGGANQQWYLNSDGSISPALAPNKCLDLPNGNTANGTKLGLWDCHDGTNQRWTRYMDGSIHGVGNKCVDNPNWQTANGTQFDYWDCNGGTNQIFQLQ